MVVKDNIIILTIKVLFCGFINLSSLDISSLGLDLARIYNTRNLIRNRLHGIYIIFTLRHKRLHKLNVNFSLLFWKSITLPFVFILL